MHSVEFHRLARRELQEASRWYRDRSLLAVSRFKKAVVEAVDRIAADPIIQPALVDAFQYVRIGRFPYLLIFEIFPNDRIFVVAVAHTSRRPGYWRRRQ